MALDDNWPSKLREIADWIDVTDPMILKIINLPLIQDIDPEKKELLTQVVNSQDMQKDLRKLADLLEEDIKYGNPLSTLN